MKKKGTGNDSECVWEREWNQFFMNKLFIHSSHLLFLWREKAYFILWTGETLWVCISPSLLKWKTTFSPCIHKSKLLISFSYASNKNPIGWCAYVYLGKYENFVGIILHTSMHCILCIIQYIVHTNLSTIVCQYTLCKSIQELRRKRRRRWKNV